MGKPRGKAAGTRVELKVVHYLRDADWIAQRAAASLGVDVIALKAGHRPQLIEVKSTVAGPFSGFGPADRKKAKAVAEMAGAEAFLYWWPPRKNLRVFPSWEWPS